MIAKQDKGEPDVDVMAHLTKEAKNCPKTYFTSVNFGYFAAIVCTIIVMLVFEHG